MQRHVNYDDNKPHNNNTTVKFDKKRTVGRLFFAILFVNNQNISIESTKAMIQTDIIVINLLVRIWTIIERFALAETRPTLSIFCNCY